MYRETCKKAENIKRAYKKEQITHFIGSKMQKIVKKTCQNVNLHLIFKKNTYKMTIQAILYVF